MAKPIVTSANTPTTFRVNAELIGSLSSSDILTPNVANLRLFSPQSAKPSTPRFLGYFWQCQETPVTTPPTRELKQSQEDALARDLKSTRSFELVESRSPTQCKSLQQAIAQQS